MAKNAETQAAIDECGAPTIVNGAQVRSGVLSLSKGAAKLSQQAALLEQLFQAASIVEDDPEIRALLPEGFQKLGAMQRETRKANDALRKVVVILDEFQQWAHRFRSACEKAGY